MSRLHASSLLICIAVSCLQSQNVIVHADESGDIGRRVARKNLVPSAEEVSSFDDLKFFARHLATKSYVPESPLTPALAELSYEQYRDINFRNGRALWSDGKHPFWLEFFHRGFVQRDLVDMHVIERAQGTNANQTRRIPYDREFFDFKGAASEVNITQPIGFAGLKIVGRFKQGGFGQEMLTFVGSSYFRARTGQTVYGTSARGLAVNIGMNEDEEFPDFRAFWVHEPAAGDQRIRILALLDSPSLTGAYRFDFDPTMTVSKVRVEAKLYFRSTAEKVAIAPLTSMWIWGDGLAPPPLDKRPSCHDADGLLVHADGKWTWRAFARLPYPSVTDSPVEHLAGFGLLQRDRNFDHYRDSGARYDERPSVWVQPLKSFGAGRIELIEIPGAHEGIDNIGAYFVADSAIDPKVPMHLKYNVFFFGNTKTLEKYVAPVAVDGRHLATCESFNVTREDDSIRLRIQFQPWRESSGNGELEAIQLRTPIVAAEFRDAEWRPVTGDRVTAYLKTVRGRVNSAEIFENGSGYMVKLRVAPTEDAPVQVSVTLRDANDGLLTETFEYLCPHVKPQFNYPAVYTRQE